MEGTAVEQSLGLSRILSVTLPPACNVLSTLIMSSG